MASTPTPSLKVILCGEFGTGKSSIFRRFATDSFTTSTDRKSTLGLDFWCKEYGNGTQIKLQLWDTGGMERVASITSSYYKFSEAAILVFSLNNSESFNCISEYLLEVVNYAENAKIFLCGNKSDLGGQQEVSDNDVEIFCEQCGILIQNYYKTSCKTGDGLDEMFNDIASTLIESSRSRIELNRLERQSEDLSFHLYDRSITPSNDDNCAC